MEKTTKQLSTSSFNVDYCPALSVVRDPVITEISFILHEQHQINFDTFNIQKKIDYFRLIRNKEHIQTWSQLEFQNRRLLHNLHASRYRTLANIEKNNKQSKEK